MDVELREVIPPHVRLAVRSAALGVRLAAARAPLWRWESASLTAPGAPVAVRYVGRPSERGRAASLLGLEARAGAAPARGSAILSEAPLPGSLRIPWSLHAVVALDRPMEQIVAGFSGDTRRLLRKEQEGFRLEPVRDGATVDRLRGEMLEPYARARHGEGAVQLAPAALRRMALHAGRMDVVVERGVAVACHVGYGFERAGRRRWVQARFGCPPGVSSDPHRMRVVNAVAMHLGLLQAAADRYDEYDMGACPARPDDGLVQWKRRRGGALDASFPEGAFWLRLPREGRAELLWHSPVFALEHGGVDLHLGLPESRSDELACTRYRELGFRGLARTWLHAARPTGPELLDLFRSTYDLADGGTRVVVVPAG